MGEIDCMDLAWAPATGLAEWFAAAGIDDRAPHGADVTPGPDRPPGFEAGEG